MRQNSNQDDSHSYDSSSINRHSNDISINNSSEKELFNSTIGDISINSNFDHDEFENETTEVKNKLKKSDGKTTSMRDSSIKTSPPTSNASVSNSSIKSPPSTSNISPSNFLARS